jgi:hypothetical protein
MANPSAANGLMSNDLVRQRCAEHQADRIPTGNTARPFLFFQPFGVDDLGGGARILRSLLASSPVRCLSIVTSVQQPQPTIKFHQIHFPTRPNFGRIKQNPFNWVPKALRPVWKIRHRRAVRRLVTQLLPAAIHVVVQPGCDLVAITVAARSNGVPLAVSFHDHPDFYLGNGQFKYRDLEIVAAMWRDARCRFVISPEMGQRLCQDFGTRDFEMVTDGVEHFGTAKELDSKPEYVVYFMGLFHEFYEENFKALLAALRQVGDQTSKRFIVRVRTNRFPEFGSNPRVRVEQLPPSDDATVAQDIERADILYLPLPFSAAGHSFAQYSLSTKMISYLGSGRPMIYHGPSTAAAANLLAKHGAAVCVTTLCYQTVVAALAELLSTPETSGNLAMRALGLAKAEFNLIEIRARFWRSMSL